MEASVESLPYLTFLIWGNVTLMIFGRAKPDFNVDGKKSHSDIIKLPKLRVSRPLGRPDLNSIARANRGLTLPAARS